jgi:hypothetical protein
MRHFHLLLSSQLLFPGPLLASAVLRFVCYTSELSHALNSVPTLQHLLKFSVWKVWSRGLAKCPCLLICCEIVVSMGNSKHRFRKASFDADYMYLFSVIFRILK